VSFLEGSGTPTMVDRALIRPPSARIGPITPDERKAVMSKSPFRGKYDTAVDPISAFEILQRRLADGGTLPPAGSGSSGGTSTPEPAPVEGGIVHAVTEKHLTERRTQCRPCSCSRRGHPGRGGVVEIDWR
jgi:hypothetical protein